jgi:ankyrin repeat protein
MAAAHIGSAAGVRLLIASGADTEAKEQEGDTALMVAQMAGRRDVAILLLKLEGK